MHALSNPGSKPVSLKTSGVEATTLERLSYIFRIYGALEILLPVPERAAAWIKAPNTAPPFGWVTSLDRMLKGNAGDLKAVADYLELTMAGYETRYSHFYA